MHCEFSTLVGSSHSMPVGDHPDLARELDRLTPGLSTVGLEADSAHQAGEAGNTRTITMCYCVEPDLK